MDDLPGVRVRREFLTLNFKMVFQPLAFVKTVCYGTDGNGQEARSVQEIPHDTDRYLDVQECAQIIKMSVRYLRDHLRAGTGPKFRRFGNRYRIRQSWLMNWQPPEKEN